MRYFLQISTILSMLAIPVIANATPMRTSDFINSLGVVAHISQGTTNYGNTSDVIADMKYLGFINIRDSYNPFWAANYLTFADAGIKWDFISAVGGSESDATVASFLSSINSLNTSVPGSVFAVEGPNEINNWPVTWSNGDTGINAGVDYQESLYKQAKADTSLANTKVYYFTGYNAGNVAIGPNPTTTAGLADYDTQHPYPGATNPPLGWINRTTALGNETPATGPAVYTETGYNLNKGINQQTEASWMLDLIADDAVNNIYRTYIYQLMDENDGSGLFTTTNTPTLAATAIHNLTTLLSDGSSTASTFTPAAFTYSISGLPTTGNSFDLQKSSGQNDILVWNETASVPGTATNTTVTFSSLQSTVKVFDPTIGTSSVKTYSNVSSIPLVVTDHPLVIQLPTTTAVPLTGISDPGTAMTNSYANDAAAASAGIAIGQFYRNGSVVQIRVK